MRVESLESVRKKKIEKAGAEKIGRLIVQNRFLTGVSCTYVFALSRGPSIVGQGATGSRGPLRIGLQREPKLCKQTFR